MPDLKDTASDDAGSLGAIRFSGPAARDFLQGQLTQDLRTLTAERVLLAACLTAQGRTLAILKLIDRPEGVIALLPRGLAPKVVAQLKRYRLRAKVDIEDVSGRLNLSATLASGGATAAHRLAGETSELSLAGGRRLTLSWSAASTAPASIATDWHAAAIRAGDAEVWPAASEAFVPQMLNLDLRDGISFSKGCYTGQEIVARTQHLGRIKRRTFLYHVDGPPPAIRAPLALDGVRVGEVLEAAPVSAGSVCLAVVNSEARAAALELPDGRRLEPEALPYAVP